MIRVVVLLALRFTHCTAIVVDLSWAESIPEKTTGLTVFGPGTVLQNAIITVDGSPQLPAGPILAYWQRAPGSRQIFNQATVLTTCEALDALQAFASASEKQVLPPPAVWISNLTVPSANGATTTYVSTAFSCVPAEPPCRGADQPATPVQPQVISSGWQLVAALAQVSRASSQAAGCLSPWEYTFQLAANISLMDLRTANQFTAPMKPYVISSNITFQPASRDQLTVLDLAEVWNLTRVINGAQVVMHNLTLVNLATAPPIAFAFPLWAMQLPSRETPSTPTPAPLPIQLSGCTLILPQDEWDFMAQSAPLYAALVYETPTYAAPTNGPPTLIQWPRTAVSRMDKFKRVDAQTLQFDKFVGLSTSMLNVVFTTRALPGFPLMHNETGLGRLLESSPSAYPSVIMIDSEQMLLDYMQPARVAEGLTTLGLLNYGPPDITHVMLALTQSFNLTPSLWRNDSGPFRVISSLHITITAWPQSRPITLGLGNTPHLIKLNTSVDIGSLRFLDLTLADLPIVRPWSPASTDSQANNALQGAFHVADMDRISTYVELKRVEVLVSEEELALRILCANRTAMDLTPSLMDHCLASQLYLRGADYLVTPSHLALVTPFAQGLGTCLKNVTFTGLPGASAAQRRPDLVNMMRAWQGLSLDMPPGGAAAAGAGGAAGASPGGEVYAVSGAELAAIIVSSVVGTTLLLLLVAAVAYRVAKKRRNAEGSLPHSSQHSDEHHISYIIGGSKSGWHGVPPNSSTNQIAASEHSLHVSEGHATGSSHASGSACAPPDHHHHVEHSDQATNTSCASAAAHVVVPVGASPLEDSAELPTEDPALIATAKSIHLRSGPTDEQACVAGLDGKPSSAGGSASSGHAGDSCHGADAAVGTEHPADGAIDKATHSKTHLSPLSYSKADQSPLSAKMHHHAPLSHGKTSHSPLSASGISSDNVRLSAACSRSERKEKKKDEMAQRPSLMNELAALTQDMEAKICDKRLEISDVIGSGGYSTVYRGLWRGLPVAVKTVLFARGGDNKTMALQEAVISKSINHPHIVATYAYDLEPIGPRAAGGGLLGGALQLVRGGTTIPDTGASDMSVGGTAHEWRLYLVMEDCDGGCLKTLIKGGALQRAGVPKMVPILELAYQVAQGMLHLHSKQIIHGDLKPENVLLKSKVGCPREFLAKVADFGLSVSMSEPQSHVSNWCKGTPFYVSPEVCGTRKLSKASDVFSYGVILWEMYHSRLVWRPGPNGLEMQPDFPSFPPTAPEQFVLLVKCCLQKDPAVRPSFEQVLTVLHGIYASEAQQQQLHLLPILPAHWEPSFSDPCTSNSFSHPGTDLGSLALPRQLMSTGGSFCAPLAAFADWPQMAALPPAIPPATATGPARPATATIPARPATATAPAATAIAPVPAPVVGAGPVLAITAISAPAMETGAVPVSVPGTAEGRPPLRLPDQAHLGLPDQGRLGRPDQEHLGDIFGDGVGFLPQSPNAVLASLSPGLPPDWQQP